MQRVPVLFRVLDDEDSSAEYGSNHPRSGHVALHPVTYDDEHIAIGLCVPPFFPPVLLFPFHTRGGSIVARFRRCTRIPAKSLQPASLV